MNTILCINGSDSTGHSGLQADIRTIKDLGGYAVTAVTSVTIQNNGGILNIHELPTELVAGQIRAIYDDERPKAVKVGMIDNAETIRTIRNEIVGCPRIVCSPEVLSSHGGCLMTNDSIRAFCTHLLPICTLLMLKCTDAEIILGRRITTDEDMTEAAKSLLEMGAEWVLLRGGTYIQGRINALLMGKDYQRFFSSVNIDGWQKHGVGGTLSTAIAAHLAAGEEVTTAIAHAHDYLHSQVVYANTSAQNTKALQPQHLYNTFLSLVADNYRTAHDVMYYAEQMNITTRYLSQITGTVAGRSPKQIIDSYLLQETEKLLANTTLTIQEIANTLGFSSQITFAKFYKTKKGFAPTAFRNSLQLITQA